MNDYEKYDCTCVKKFYIFEFLMTVKNGLTKPRLLKKLTWYEETFRQEHLRDFLPFFVL